MLTREAMTPSMQLSEPPLGRPDEDRPVRLLLIESLVLFRTSLAKVLGAEPDLEVAAECGSLSEGLQILKTAGERPIDLVVLDFDEGVGDPAEFIRTAQRAGYRGGFLILATSADIARTAVALSLGAAGIFMKSDRPQRLVQAIRTVMGGDTWIDRSVVQTLAGQLVSRAQRPSVRILGDKLDEREKTVLLGIMDGLSNKRIGAALGLSESSAKNIVQHLFAMTGVRTRSQLVRLLCDGSFGTLQHPESSADRDRPAQ